jgi:coenzyme PQQ synthesis protein D (PqqD)
MSSVMLSDQATVAVTADQVACDLDGEVAILHVKSGVYYGLDRTGAWIWSFIQVPRTVAEIRASLVARYDVEPERAARDLDRLLGNLAREGLVEIRVAPAG